MGRHHEASANLATVFKISDTCWVSVLSFPSSSILPFLVEPRESAKNRARSRYNTVGFLHDICIRYPKAGCMSGGVFDFINQLAVGTINWSMVLEGHKNITISSGNGLSPVWRQTISWTNTNLFSIEPSGKKKSLEIWIRIPSHYLNQYRHVVHWTLRTNFSEISIRMH